MHKRKKFSEKNASQIRPETSIPSALPLSVPAGVVLIAVAAFLVYFPSLNGSFVFDDDELLTNSRLIKASDGLYRFWCTTESDDYWPITYTTLWIEWRLWGLNPTGYRIDTHWPDSGCD